MAGLTSEQVEQFQREGYLLVENMFDPATDNVIDFAGSPEIERPVQSDAHSRFPMPVRAPLWLRLGHGPAVLTSPTTTMPMAQN